jgi:hypothetical protein
MTDTTNAPITPTPMFTAAVKDRFWSSPGRGNDRTRQAIALRNQGHTYQEIADRLGYGHRMGAHWAVNDSVIARGMRAKATQMPQNATNLTKMTQDTAPHATSGRTGDSVNAGRRAA